jgi:DNA-binding FadR family transcriptional regulator
MMFAYRGGDVLRRHGMPCRKATVKSSPDCYGVTDESGLRNASVSCLRANEPWETVPAGYAYLQSRMLPEVPAPYVMENEGVAVMNTVMSESSSLYAAITGETAVGLKRAQFMARLVEEDLIADGWPVGKRCGSEEQMAARYQASRCVAREAIRILQLRGSVLTQRGPGGGVVVAATSIEDIAQAISNHFTMAGVSRATVLEAHRIINSIAAVCAAKNTARKKVGGVASTGPHYIVTAHEAACDAKVGAFSRRVAELTDNAAVVLLVHCMETLMQRLGIATPIGHSGALADEEIFNPVQCAVLRAIEFGDPARAAAAMIQYSDGIARTAETVGVSSVAFISGVARKWPRASEIKGGTRAGQIAQILASAIKRGNCERGERLGSEAELGERYGVSRSVMRQAIRILEDSGTVDSQRGRGRGLIAQEPPPGPIIRLMCSHLIERRLTMMQAQSVIRPLHVELAGLAGQKVTPEDREQMGRIVRELPNWNSPVERLTLGDAECAPVAVARNPVLASFTRVLLAFACWTSPQSRAYLPSSLAERYRCKARDVIEAICSGHAAHALDAEEEKHEFFTNCVWRRHSLTTYRIRRPLRYANSFVGLGGVGA